MFVLALLLACSYHNVPVPSPARGLASSLRTGLRAASALGDLERGALEPPGGPGQRVCGVACQMSLSSWKILYSICRSVYMGCCCCRLHFLQNNLPTPSPPRRHVLQVVSSYGFPVSLLLPPLALSSLILGFIFTGNMAEFPVSGLDGASWGPPRGQN